jgi:hypothetical protein
MSRKGATRSGANRVIFESRGSRQIFVIASFSAENRSFPLFRTML